MVTVKTELRISKQFPCLASVCPLLRDPGNGTVTVIGHRAQYSCEQNYSLVGLEGTERACVEGEWIGQDPACRRGEVGGGMIEDVIIPDSLRLLPTCTNTRYSTINLKLF